MSKPANANQNFCSQPNTSRANSDGTFTNPIVWADIPDPDVVRVGDAYYMSSTTMYFCPGCPIMKSTDLVNWKIVNYVYDTLDDSDSMTLRNGRHAYGKGSWASSIRLHNETFYVTFVANNTGKTYIYQTEDIENGPWRRYVLDGIFHDMSLLFDDDGRVFMVYGGKTIRVIELTSDATAIKPGGMNKVIIENANENIGGGGGLGAEGAHIYKLNGMYYIFLIAWPPPPEGSGKRIELCYRADSIDGKYEGKVVFDSDVGSVKAGVAQGGIVDTPNGDWYALLFQDHGSVGRIPCLIPVRWENNWPVFGIDGKAPENAPMPALGSERFSVVISDEFDQRDVVRDFTPVNDLTYKSSNSVKGENDHNGSNLALEWQWNHNPDNNNWSLTQRPGYLRLTTGTVCKSLTDARNTLTQRTFGPECSGVVSIDVSNMKDGDYAGLAALQDQHGFVGVKMADGAKYIIMANSYVERPVMPPPPGAGGRPRRGYEIGIPAPEIESIPLKQNIVYLKIDFDFKNMNDKANFYYSLDGENWSKIGNTLSMSYRLSHFVGYRFALFNFATIETGGYVDFDYFRAFEEITE